MYFCYHARPLELDPHGFFQISPNRKVRPGSKTTLKDHSDYMSASFSLIYFSGQTTRVNSWDATSTVGRSRTPHQRALDTPLSAVATFGTTIAIFPSSMARPAVNEPRNVSSDVVVLPSESAAGHRASHKRQRQQPHGSRQTAAGTSTARTETHYCWAITMAITVSLD